MKIVLISTNDVNGGASRAAYRLHRGLIRISLDSYLAVLVKSSDDTAVHAVQKTITSAQLNDEHNLRVLIQDNYLDKHRTHLSNTLFSFPYPGYDIARSTLLKHADVINLHWINYFLSLHSLKSIFDLGKPVVWTLHDQWAFTGGCHYSAGCSRYESTCSGCPQLSNDSFELPSAILRDKIELFKGANLTIVTPSKWLGDCARRSTLFKNTRIEIIPNAVEKDIFYPVDKNEAKRRLDISPDTRTILFGAEAGNEYRKGFKELLGALQVLLKQSDIQRLIAASRIRLLVFGNPSDELASLGIPIISFGYVKSDELLRTIYSAADLYALSSREDNLPNTMLEAMACGTPVIAFRIGGMPDVIVNNKTGFLATPFDVHDFGRSMLRLLRNPHDISAMGEACSHLIQERYTLGHQANKYLALYSELLEQHVNIRSSGGARPQFRDDQIEKDTFSASLTTEVGPHFRSIYDRVVAKALEDMKQDTSGQVTADGFVKRALRAAYGLAAPRIKKVPIVGPAASALKKRLKPIPK